MKENIKIVSFKTHSYYSFVLFWCLLGFLSKYKRFAQNYWFSLGNHWFSMDSSVSNRFSQYDLVPLDLAGRLGSARSRSTIRNGEKKNVHSRGSAPASG